ncbi:DNA mismatch repair endonuclease MutL [candidate division WOR-3 bacterium]|nr:DNA mismatch repair endonuclease MutL [candidate division WOR-3 bacterium]
MKSESNRIIQLSKDLRNKIAAGEVIEGPFACVKELIENAIDANASKITIDIENGGKSLISVSDNGVGIYPDDIRLVIERYSTSKLESNDDLLSINSMGFRGEALSAIASVSQVEMLSRYIESDMGKYIKIENGKIIQEKSKQRQRGTSVIVKYLFNNYPARRKFLHSTSAEFRKILNEVTPKCIAFPEIAFVLTHNGNEIINVSSGSREERLLSMMDESFFNSLIPIEYEGTDEIKIEGWVQKPNLPSQKKYNLFVNKRNVWDGRVFRLIRDFYTPFGNENPSFVLFVTLPTDAVDVNVHPTKREVRFHREEKILAKIHHSLNKTIGEGSKYREQLFSFETDYLFEGDVRSKFWQLHDSYIVAQTKNGLVVIDQHAAHERVLYDNLKSSDSLPSQTLLFPLQIKHTPLEISKLQQVEDELVRLGFRFRILSGNTVIWESVPAMVEDITEDGISGILEDLAGERETSLHNILKSVSCHMAIKAGDPLSPQEMEHLVNLLFSTETPFRCPHGRPIIYELSLKELEKKFQR